MELEKAPLDNGILIKKSTLDYIPTCLKVTFELPVDIGYRFLHICDLTNRDPDRIVTRLISQWVAEEIDKCR